MPNVIRRLCLWGCLVIALGLTTALGGCKSLFSADQEAIVRVDSIDAPETIVDGDTLNVRVWGMMLGPTACWRLSDVEKKITPDSVVVRFHSARHGDGPCIDTPVQLNYETEVPPPRHDPFTIVARQPSGPALRKTVRVGAQ